jgi:chromosome segregation ATPase
MSDDKDTKRLGEDDESLSGDALLHAVRRDMQGLFGSVKALDEKVEALDAKVETRLRDTTPMWEVAVSRLDTIIAEQESQGRRLAAIEAKLERFDAIDTELRHLRRRIERTLGELSTNVIGYRIDQHDLEDRLEKLEKTPA